ncbi:MAG: hypothetical protein ACK5TH_07775 [Prosthecobacter sp.]|jgi:hypothetical protein
MKANPILQEIWDYRAEHAKKFDYDIGRMIEDVRSRQGMDGVRVVNRSKRMKRLAGKVASR